MRCKLSLNENLPDEEPNISDIVYTNTQYYIAQKKFNKKLKKDVPDKYIISCDMFPKNFIRVRDWADFMKIVEDPTAANHKVAKWLYRNTQIEERMFLLLGDNENVHIQFTINIIDYVKKLADKANRVPSLEMIFDKNLLEINRERAKLS